MTASNSLPSDLADFQESYVKLLGSMPPLPGASGGSTKSDE